MRSNARWARQGISRYHGRVTRAKRKNPNRAGTDARKRKDGRYETRVTLNTPIGRRRVSFYGATAEEANNKKFQALADQAHGVLFSDPGRLIIREYLHSWLTDAVRYQVSESTFERYERTCRNHLVPFFGPIKLRDLKSCPRPRLQGPQDRGGPEPQHRGRHAGGFLRSPEPGGGRWAYPREPCLPRQESRYARAGANEASLP